MRAREFDRLLREASIEGPAAVPVVYELGDEPFG
jgi:hypothetical protein